MGCYPLFCCEDWALLKGDIAAIAKDGPVSLVLVTDPFGNWTLPGLKEAFPDLCRPYKIHNVIDFTESTSTALDRNHMRNIRRALDHLNIATLEDPSKHLSDWNGLYANLIARHEITGVSAFSAESFELQFEIPGLWAFAARQGDEIVGMTLWYQQGDSAYYHLGAYSDAGYALSASFGIFWTAIEFFRRKGLKRLDLGAGLDPQGTDGLARFKRGWANTECPVYLCGRILDPGAYALLATTSGNDPAYFPTYRS